MENTSYIALSRQAALRRQMEIVANNLANMNTTAFKGEGMMFVDHLIKSRGGEHMIPEKLTFVRDIATVRDLSEGPIQATSNPLDVAIKGDGYFVIDTPEGERFTRVGSFQIDAQGQLTTEQGYPVLSNGGQPFVFGPGDTQIDIARDGTVSTANGVQGRFRIVTFDNEQALRKTFGGLYESEAPPQDVEAPEVVQHALEGSNVNSILELTQMIEVQRSYDSVRKMIEAEDERMKKMVSELAKVSA